MLVAAVAAGVAGHDLLMEHGLSSFLQVLAGLLVLLGISGWPLWRALDRWLLQPLELLAASDRRVARGELLAAFVPDLGPPEDEMGDILRARNVMLRQLIEQHDGLQQEKTRAEAVAAQLAQTLAQLERAESTHIAELKSVLEHLPAGVCVLDAGHHVQVTNPSARTLLADIGGFEPKGRLTALAGCAVDDLLRSATDSPQRELKAAGDRSIEVRSARIETDSSRGRWVMLLRDTTEEREAQRREERQGRLAAVGQLAAGIAHDFNNILTAIIGFAELAQTADAMDQVRADAERIVQGGRRASKLVRQILDFSRKTVTQRQPVDLAPVVKETLDMLERTLPETVRIIRDFQASRCVVIADAGQLGQLLTNLVVNARDAMPHGGLLTVRIDKRTLSGPNGSFSGIPAGQWIVLSVADTGEGISADVLKHVFEPFFTTKEPGKGTGLGLAQVYGIIKQHDGYIEIDPGAGRGATFSVWLPDAAAEHVREFAGEQHSSRGRGERVLLVEDDPAVREALERILSSFGFRVEVAASGQGALQLLAENRLPDIVLSDVVMPEVGGVELLHRMRQQGCTLPVILMSGYPMGDAAGQDASAAAAWLEKPLEPEVVARTLRQVLDRRANSAV